MSYGGINETRSYNSMGQLTSVSAGSGVNKSYTYPSGSNNGKACMVTDYVSGEQVVYQ